MKKHLSSLALVAALFAGSTTAVAAPESYKLDPAHSFVTFSISHLGTSLLHGRFNQVSGAFTRDEANPEAGAIQVTVETASVDSNHAERDKHLRSGDFLDVTKFPKAEFKSKRIVEKDKVARVEGELTLHGVTKPVAFDAEMIGAGPDPWGGFRRGYAGKITIRRADYGISYNLGPTAETMELGLFVEGIRQ